LQSVHRHGSAAADSGAVEAEGQTAEGRHPSRAVAGEANTEEEGAMMLSFEQELLTAVGIWWETIAPRSAEEMADDDEEKFRAWIEPGVWALIKNLGDAATEARRLRQRGDSPRVRIRNMMEMLRMILEEDRRQLAWWILNGMPECG
jgi:hypothetical protein